MRFRPAVLFVKCSFARILSYEIIGSHIHSIRAGKPTSRLRESTMKVRDSLSCPDGELSRTPPGPS